MQTPVYAGHETTEDDIRAVLKRETSPIDNLPDGFVRLKRRELSRLWFRMPRRAAARADRGAISTSAEDLGIEQLVSEAVRVELTELPTSILPAARPVAAPDDHLPTRGLTEWRAVQAGAPVLLLSAGPVLESGRPGPILGPGKRYRITSMTGSVVGLEVMHANGDTRSGYANAVDLRCIEPRIQTGALQSEQGLTGRLRLTKLAAAAFGLFGG